MNSSKKNILIMTQSLEVLGGAITLSNNISDILAQSHNVYQVSFDQAGGRRVFNSDIPYYAIGSTKYKNFRIVKLVYRLLIILRLRRLKKFLDIDLSISVLWEADLISALSGGADRKISLMVTNIYDNPTNRHMLRYPKIFEIIYRRFDKVLAINRPVLQELASLLKITDHQQGTFRNFLPPTHPIPIWQDDQIRRYVFCGRFVQEKNLEGLLHVWQAFSSKRNNVQLIILGDGPLSNFYHQLASDLNMKVGFTIYDNDADILFLGLVARPEDYMINCRALVVPSRNEGTPTVIIMALFLGLPVIAADSNGGCISDMLRFNDLEGHVNKFEVAFGLLLPIPTSENPSTISIWTKQLLDFDLDSSNWKKKRISAKNLSQSFTVESAQEEWSRLLNQLYNH